MTTPASIVIDNDPTRMAAAIETVRGAFRDFDRGLFDMPVRTAFASGRDLVMPVHHRPSGTTAVKVLHIDSSRSPAITGIVVWSGPDGQLVADAGDLTALRTGAVSGVATDLLSDPGSSILTIIGAGAQALTQVAGVLAVRPISEVRVVARRSEAAERLAAAIRRDAPGIDVRVMPDVASAIRTAHVITCATSSLEPVLQARDLPETVHLNAVGSYRLDMRELPDEAFRGADIVVDSTEASSHEAGEVVSAIAAGVIGAGDLSELGRRLNDDEGARSSRTIFKSVGLAIQDWAALAGLAGASRP